MITVSKTMRNATPALGGNVSDRRPPPRWALVLGVAVCLLAAAGGSAVAVWVQGPPGEVAEIAQRRQRVATMSRIEKDQLKESKARFAALTESRRNEVRKLHDELSALPDEDAGAAEGIQTIMTNFAAWWRHVANPAQREQLIRLMRSPAERAEFVAGMALPARDQDLVVQWAAKRWGHWFDAHRNKTRSGSRPPSKSGGPRPPSRSGNPMREREGETRPPPNSARRTPEEWRQFAFGPSRWPNLPWPPFDDASYEDLATQLEKTNAVAAKSLRSERTRDDKRTRVRDWMRPYDPEITSTVLMEYLDTLDESERDSILQDLVNQPSPRDRYGTLRGKYMKAKHPNLKPRGGDGRAKPD